MVGNWKNTISHDFWWIVIKYQQILITTKCKYIIFDFSMAWNNIWRFDLAFDFFLNSNVARFCFWSKSMFFNFNCNLIWIINISRFLIVCKYFNLRLFSISRIHIGYTVNIGATILRFPERHGALCFIFQMHQCSIILCSGMLFRWLINYLI